MSQQVINANAQSNVEKVLTGASKVQELTYKTAKSYPNISKSMKVVNPTTSFQGGFSNNTDVFEITENDMLNLLRLKFVGVKPTNLVASLKSAYVAENFINTLTLKMNGQPIATMEQPAIIAHYQDSPSSVQENHYRYAMPCVVATEELISDAANVNTFVCYLGVPSSFFTSAFRNILLTGNDTVSLEILYNSYARAGFDEEFTSLSTTLQVHKWRGDEETMKMIKNVDYTNNQYRLGWSSFTEKQVLTNTTSVTFTCQGKNADFKLYPIIMKTDPAATAPLYGCPKAKIRKVTVQLGDEFYIYNFSKSQVNFENAYKGASSCHKVENDDGTPVLVYMDDKQPCIEFSLECRDDSNTGMAAFKNLNNPIITLEYDDPLTAGDVIGRWTLFTVHKFWQILESDPGQKLIFTKMTT